jgi:hypothetical protein
MGGHYNRFKGQPSINRGSKFSPSKRAGSSEAADKAIDRSGRAKTKKTKSNREINEALEKKQKDRRDQANIKDDGLLPGIGFKGQKVDRTVEKEDYKDPRKHKLRNQFDYLVDKYYGGTEQGAKEFAKTSQGQLLLGYLAGVSADRGGGRGGDTQALQQGLAGTDIARKLEGRNPADRDFDPIFRPRNFGITASDIRNLNVPQIRQNFTTGGIEDTAAFRRFNEALQVAAPDAFAQARPFSSGQGIGTLIEQGAGFVPGLGMASRFISNLLPQRATGGLSPDEYLSQDLFANLPMDERVDRGGVNDVAQSIINNQAPVLPPEEDIAKINPEDMVIPGFGIDDPNRIEIFPLPLGGVTEVLPGFTSKDVVRLLANRGIFSTV